MSKKNGVKMPKYVIEAKSTRLFEIELEADSELHAYSQLDEWEADDFEPYAVDGMWEFDAQEIE